MPNAVEHLTPDNGMSYLERLCVAKDRGQVVQNILDEQHHVTVRQKILDGYNLIIHFGQPWVRVLGAHFDKVEVGQGANDNGAAVAQLLALAGRLKAQEYQGPLTIVFFDQEERLALGRVEDMGSYALGEALAFEDHLPDVFLVLDVTGIGISLIVSDVEGLSQHHPNQVLLDMESWLHGACGHVQRFSTPPSDNYALRWHGIPSLLLTLLPANLDTSKVWNRIHSLKDSLKSIQPAAMSFMAQVLDDLAHAPLRAPVLDSKVKG